MQTPPTSHRINIVFGCLGFIGHSLTAALLQRESKHSEDEYILVDILPDSNIVEKQRRLYLDSMICNLSQRVKITWMLETNYASRKLIPYFTDKTTIYSFAANPGVQQCNINPQLSMDNIINMTTLLANIEISQGKPTIIHASSSSSLSSISTLNLARNTTLNVQIPKSNYGFSKSVQDMILEKYAKILDLKVYNFRFYTVYGPRGRPDMAVLKFCRQILNRENIHLFGVDQKRDWTYIEDLIKAILAFKPRNTKENFVITDLGSGKPILVSKLISLLTQCLKTKSVVFVEESRPFDPVETKGHGIINHPTPLHIGLQKTVQWFLNQNIHPIRIFAVVASKNRKKMLINQCLPHILAQKRKPDYVFVINDGNEDFQNIHMENVHFEKNRLTPGASGAWNTGILLAMKHCVTYNYPLSHTYIAICDDDDFWDDEYLTLHEEKAKETHADVIYSGIYRCSSGKKSPQSIPEELHPQLFLEGNPHIQGSNMFLRLSTLLESGLFGEGLESCTDRDLMIRLLDLGVSTERINKHLVYHFVDGDDRLSTPGPRKSRAIDIFMNRYSNRMENREKCELRFQKYFNWKPKTFDDIKTTEQQQTPQRRSKVTQKRYNLVFGIVSDSNKTLVKPLLQDICAIKSQMTKTKDQINIDSVHVFILENGVKSTELHSVVSSLLTENAHTPNLSIHFIRELDQQVLQTLPEWTTRNFSKIRKSIAATRSIIQYYCGRFILSTGLENPLTFILDDDKSFNYFQQNNQLSNSPMYVTQNTVEKPLKINWNQVFETIQAYPETKVWIGHDIGAPPLPNGFSIRTQLVDIYHHLNVNEMDTPKQIDLGRDFYHDRVPGIHREHPLWDKNTIKNLNHKLKMILNGSNVTRPLKSPTSTNPISSIFRGGCTLMTNPEDLFLCNPAITIGDTETRRSDFLWCIYLLKHRNKYNQNPDYIKTLPSLQVFHRRFNSQPIDFVKQIQVWKADLVGSSLYRTILSEHKLHGVFFKHTFDTHILSFVAGLYRIKGLASIIYKKTQNSSLKYLLKNLNPGAVYQELCSNTALIESQMTDFSQKNFWVEFPPQINLKFNSNVHQLTKSLQSQKYKWIITEEEYNLQETFETGYLYNLSDGLLSNEKPLKLIIGNDIVNTKLYQRKVCGIDGYFLNKAKILKLDFHHASNYLNQKLKFLAFPVQQNLGICPKLNEYPPIKLTVSVCGFSNTNNEKVISTAQNLGKVLAQLPITLVTGGMGGVMFHTSKSYFENDGGDSISLLPGYDPLQGHPYSTINIPTHLGNFRNNLMSQSDIMIVIGGGAGTLSELAAANLSKRPILLFPVNNSSTIHFINRVDHRSGVNSKPYEWKDAEEISDWYYKHAASSFLVRHKGIV